MQTTTPQATIPVVAETCDKCGPTVRATHRSTDYGLTFCGHCAATYSPIIVIVPLEG